MKPSSRIVEGPAACHGWTVYAIDNHGRLRCLYCLLEVTTEVRQEQSDRYANAVLADQKNLRRKHRQTR